MKNRLVLVFVSLLFLAACGSSSEKKEKAENNWAGNGLEALNKSLLQDSLNIDLLIKRAAVYLESGQMNRALQDINQAMELSPNSIDVYLTLADVYFAMGMPENCNAALLRALEIDTDDTRTHIKLAELNLLLQNHTLAMGYLDQAIAISSFNPEAHYVRAMLYMSRRDTLRAIRSFQLALNQREDFYEPLIQLGIIYSARNNELAEFYLSRAIQLFPQSLQARYQLALYFQERGYLEDAVAQYDTILMRQPGNKHVLFNLGYVNLIYKLRYDRAIEFFDEALLADPNYIEALYNKGLALEEMGRIMAARDVYREVLNKRSNYSLAIQALNRLDRGR